MPSPDKWKYFSSGDIAGPDLLMRFSVLFQFPGRAGAERMFRVPSDAWAKEFSQVRAESRRDFCVRVCARAYMLIFLC